MHMHKHVDMYIHIDVYKHIYMHACMHMCMSMYIDKYMHMYMCMCFCIYMYMHRYIYTCTNCVREEASEWYRYGGPRNVDHLISFFLKHASESPLPPFFDLYYKSIDCNNFGFHDYGCP